MSLSRLLPSNPSLHGRDLSNPNLHGRDLSNPSLHSRDLYQQLVLAPDVKPLLSASNYLLAKILCQFCLANSSLAFNGGKLPMSKEIMKKTSCLDRYCLLLLDLGGSSAFHLQHSIHDGLVTMGFSKLSQTHDDLNRDGGNAALSLNQVKTCRSASIIQMKAKPSRWRLWQPLFGPCGSLFGHVAFSFLIFRPNSVRSNLFI